MLHTISTPVFVYQKQAGTWRSWLFDGVAIADVVTYQNQRTVTMSFGDQPDKQGYQPRLNDILVPMDNGQVESRAFFSRTDEPYFFSREPNWERRPAIMFLTAYDDNYTFKDIWSLDENALIKPGTYEYSRMVADAGSQVWNRLAGDCPVLAPVTAEYTIMGGDWDTGVNVTYEDATVVSLSDVVVTLIGYYGGLGAAGSSFDMWNYDGDSGASLGFVTKVPIQIIHQTQIDIRLEDVLQLEVRTRESADSPNETIVYTKTGTRSTAYLLPDGTITVGTPPAGDTWSPRVDYQEADDLNTATVKSKAGSSLISSIFTDMRDISIVLDLTSRYAIIPKNIELSWALPYPGELVRVWGYTETGYITVPVREYDFSSGKMLLATNNDIKLDTEG